ncbi:MAG: hypothetical protein AAF945_17200 [Actinomycetota bacterium]
MTSLVWWFVLFGVAGFAFGRTWRRIFRKRRIGLGRVLLGRIVLVSCAVVMAAVYGGVLADGESQLTSSSRPVATFGLPALFIVAAAIAYRRGTRTRVVSQRSGPPLVVSNAGPAPLPLNDEAQHHQAAAAWRPERAEPPPDHASTPPPDGPFLAPRAP